MKISLGSWIIDKVDYLRDVANHNDIPEKARFKKDRQIQFCLSFFLI
ncbi:hypothetical protein LSAJ156_350066 [Latilactobacillus sakei]|nr:hypothetical protein LSAJ160_210021 [Latilactobacillus sakei]GEP20989.1 hypothetical protein LSA03nite_05770 [Latilactobacillus sakei subsp. carnosus]SOB39572.1 hypothetical protein LSAJ156_350066 [Latilactobacillus sakei]SOB43940.1 hypothetical protein LSAJ112_270016 [Latilactobacillus sakei]SON65665.1 protein of unknown function [Latilactobacillus sakei]